MLKNNKILYSKFLNYKWRVNFVFDMTYHVLCSDRALSVPAFTFYRDRRN